MASGGIGAMNFGDWWTFILFGIGATIMRPVGCIINDIWDRNLDKDVERTSTRPLASGQLRVGQAIWFLSILLFFGFAILIQMNLVTILLGFLSLPLIVIYPLMKRWTWWPQAFLGMVFNFGALMGWSAVTGILEIPALLLYAGCVLWTLGYDTVYAHQDKEDDAVLGIKSTALKLGDQSVFWVRVFFGLSWFLILLAAVFSLSPFLSPLFLLPAAVYLYRQISVWDMNDPASSLAFFQASRNYGLLILVGLLVSGF